MRTKAADQTLARPHFSPRNFVLAAPSPSCENPRKSKRSFSGEAFDSVNQNCSQEPADALHPALWSVLK